MCIYTRLHVRVFVYAFAYARVCVCMCVCVLSMCVLRPRGFAFVTFETEPGAEACIKDYDNHTLGMN